jgi:hypothetical protein
LDPRNASRTPSASKELHYKLRWLKYILFLLLMAINFVADVINFWLQIWESAWREPIEKLGSLTSVWWRDVW